MWNNNKLILNSVLIFSIFSLIIAYYIQYVLGHKPCNLCLVERIPYIAAIILISMIFMINKFKKVIAKIVMLFFILGAVVSAYHVGVEQDLFSESFVCDLGQSKESLSKEDLLKQLQNKSVVSCKNVTFKLFGLSLATINTVISILFIVIMRRVIKNYGQNK
tara:strand:+ start:12 stop:497 length:486 start_codon:yes stop_codon:yes gene_type:complete